MLNPRNNRNKWALLIGIDQYSNWHSLRGCVNDVELMAEILQHNFGFSPDNIALLLDEEASRHGILTAMNQLLDRVEKDDVVVMYYTGHGSQVVDPTSTSPDGLVSTIVPQDSGRAPHPYRDITYGEIYEWLLRLTEITAFTTIIFDCDHAGAISLGMASGDIQKRYVFIGACRTDETCYEAPVEGLSHGALSYALGQALVDAKPGTTYRDVFQQASAQVTAMFPSQHPQMEGDSDRVLSDVDEIESMRFVRITRREGDSVTLAAGAAHGMTTNSRWTIYPVATHRVTNKTRELGVVWITTVGATESEARVLAEVHADAVAEGTKAIERTHYYGEMQLVVYIPNLPNYTDEQDELKELVKESELLRLAADDEPPNVTARIVLPGTEVREEDPLAALGAVTEPTWAVVDESGLFVMPTYPVESPAAKWTLRENLEKLARRRNLAGLKNPNLNSPLRGKVDFLLKRQAADGSWVVAEPEEHGAIPAFEEGDLIAFEITNHHSDPIFISVLDFELDGEIALLHPIEGDSGRLMPDQSIEIGVREKDLEVYIPDGFPFVPAAPEAKRRSIGVETLKLFAATHEIDFKSLILQDGARGISSHTGEATPLWQLFDKAMTGYSTKNSWPVNLPMDLDWFTIERSFAIVQRRSRGR